MNTKKITQFLEIVFFVFDELIIRLTWIHMRSISKYHISIYGKRKVKALNFYILNHLTIRHGKKRVNINIAVREAANIIN